MSKVISLADHRVKPPFKATITVGGAARVPMSEPTKSALTEMMYEAITLIAKTPRSEAELALLNKKQELQIRNREKL